MIERYNNFKTNPFSETVCEVINGKISIEPYQAKGHGVGVNVYNNVTNQIVMNIFAHNGKKVHAKLPGNPRDVVSIAALSKYHPGQKNSGVIKSVFRFLDNGFMFPQIVTNCDVYSETEKQQIATLPFLHFEDLKTAKRGLELVLNDKLGDVVSSSFKTGFVKANHIEEIRTKIKPMWGEQFKHYVSRNKHIKTEVDTTEERV